MKFIIVFFVCLFSLNKTSIAGDTIVKYFNRDWVEIDDKVQASFYRKIYQKSEKLWIVLDYFKSQKLQMSGSYSNKKLTKKQGHFDYYFENGRKSIEGDFADDLKTGVWIEWHENGKKSTEGNYKAGKREGNWVAWYDNGQKRAEGLYVNDEQTGKWVYGFESGERKSEGVFINGQKDGDWTYFYKSGSRETVEEFRDFKLVFITGYFEGGQVNFKGKCKNNMSEGEWNYWNVDGRLCFTGNFSENKQDGKWTRYFSDGSSMDVYYKKGVLSSESLGGIVKTD